MTLYEPGPRGPRERSTDAVSEPAVWPPWVDPTASDAPVAGCPSVFPMRIRTEHVPVGLPSSAEHRNPPENRASTSACCPAAAVTVVVAPGIDFHVPPLVLNGTFDRTIRTCSMDPPASVV